MPSNPDACFRFGSFEIDAERRLLRRSGVKIRLQEQPFEVLLALVEARGELVTREQLRQRLWPSGTFVEFDDALNTAVKKIRVALCDDAAVPRYIETIPRRGYRFLATLETALTTGCQLGHDSVVVQSSSPRFPPRLRVLAAVSVVLLAFLVYGTWQILRPTSANDVVVAILPLTNMNEKSVDDALILTLHRSLSEELQRQHPARVRVHNLSPSHIDYVLQGSLRGDEQRVHVCVQLIRLSDQNRVWSGDFDANSPDSKSESALAAEIAHELQPTLDLLSGTSR